MSSISEIYGYKKENAAGIISLTVAIALVLFCIALLCFNWILVFKERRIQNEHSKLGEFFTDLKQNSKARHYNVLRMIRRFIFVFLVIVLAPSLSYCAIFGITLIQLVFYITYATIVRPYVETKNNIIEISNELFFTFLLASLFYYNSESRWTSLAKNIYIWVILSNNAFIFIVIFVASIISIIKMLKQKCCTPRSIAPKQNLNSEQPEFERNSVQVLRPSNRSELETKQKHEESKYEEPKSEVPKTKRYPHMFTKCYYRD